MSRHTAQTMSALRQRLGLSQTELARRMGYARAYINRLENGRLAISAEVDERLRGIEAGVTYQEKSQGEAAQIEEEHGSNALPYDRSSDAGSRPAHREPGAQELTDEFLILLGKARSHPGGLYQLQRMLKRFEKDHIDPIE
jgi:transcriptional regulator with XRE-family HTH domain